MSAPPPPYPGNSDPAYPPQQGGYPPQQGGYPPQQGGYPPQQQGGYPPEKGGPPQQGQPPPGGYPQPQGQAYPPGQAPPPAAYAQPGQPGYTQSSTVVVTQPIVTATVVQHFRECPVQTACPHCRAQIVTAVHYETGTLTWLLCAVVCLVGCDLGCCFIPFCIDGCKDVIHTCPNCRQMVGRWNRL